MTTTNILRMIRRNLADYGPRLVFAKGVRYLVQPWYQDTLYRVYVIAVPPPGEPPASPEGLELRLLTPDDVGAIRQVEAMAEWLEGRVTAKLGQGYLCLVALAGDEVAAFNLVGVGEVAMPVVKMRWVFGDDEAWSEQITTHQNWRKRGLATALRARIVFELGSRQIKWLFGATRVDNQAALALARRAGFTELGDLHYSRRLRRQTWEFKEFDNVPLGERLRPFDGLDKLSADQLALQPESHRT